MFKVVYNNRIGAHTVRDVKKAHVYLHSDGAVFDTPEYWPTKKLAQAVLDKYHVWEHGDVFIFNTGLDHGTMIFIQTRVDNTPSLFYVDKDAKAYDNQDYYLSGATFLFNIKSKL